MRPRVPGHRRFQVEAGELIHRYLWARDIQPTECLRRFAQLAEKRLHTGGYDA
jgi:hypothetical protein